MKDDDFADGVYQILAAVDFKLGGGHDVSTGIDYRNDALETFSYWAHCECSCSFYAWEEDLDYQTELRMKQYSDVDPHSSEWWRLYQMEYENVRQGEEREHDEDCSLEEVGFRHFGSGLEVSWYKRVGRSTESNKSMKALDWYKIVVECIESVKSDERMLK